MQSIALVIHVILAVVVIVLVLMQHGKGADAGAAFGSGASATVFGARGASSFLTRMTTAAATLFFVTSVFLFWLAAHREAGVRSVTDVPGLVEEVPAPVVVPGDIAPDEAASDLPGGVPAAGEALPAPGADEEVGIDATLPEAPSGGIAPADPVSADPAVAPTAVEPSAVPAPADAGASAVEPATGEPASD